MGRPARRTRPDGVELGDGILGASAAAIAAADRAGGPQLAELRQCAGALGEQLSPPRGGHPAPASARSHKPISVVATGGWPTPRTTSAATATGRPPAGLGIIRGGDRVPNAVGELAGPVLRGGQLDQQRGALGPPAPAASAAASAVAR